MRPIWTTYRYPACTSKEPTMALTADRAEVVGSANYYARCLLAQLEQITPEDTENPALDGEFRTLIITLEQIMEHPAAGVL